MPPFDEHPRDVTLEEVVQKVDRYPIEAFIFVQQGLSYTVEKHHGPKGDPETSRHVTGRDLCAGLLDYARQRWGMMARTVLRRWNINGTYDFGRIVFAMVDNGLMQKTDDDTIEDFRNVFDFRTAFESGYRISCDIEEKLTEGRP
jgi:uncharacterized repeat protein (TIGR04138 family)